MKEDVKNAIRFLWEHHRGKFVGTLLGGLFAILVLVIGFFPTVFLVLCSGIGFLVGARIDRGGILEEMRDRLLERFQYWHRF